MTSYLSEIPEELIELRWPERIGAPHPAGTGVAILPASVWEGLDAYEGTLPTAPSNGRIYRRGGCVKVVIEDEAEPGWSLHVPFAAEVVDD